MQGGLPPLALARPWWRGGGAAARAGWRSLPALARRPARPERGGRALPPPARSRRRPALGGDPAGIRPAARRPRPQATRPPRSRLCRRVRAGRARGDRPAGLGRGGEDGRGTAGGAAGGAAGEPGRWRHAPLPGQLGAGPARPGGAVDAAGQGGDSAAPGAAGCRRRGSVSASASTEPPPWPVCARCRGSARGRPHTWRCGRSGTRTPIRLATSGFGARSSDAAARWTGGRRNAWRRTGAPGAPTPSSTSGAASRIHP